MLIMLDKIYKDEDKFNGTKDNFDIKVITPKEVVIPKEVVTAKKVLSNSQIFKFYFVSEKILGINKAYKKSYAIMQAYINKNKKLILM